VSNRILEPLTCTYDLALAATFYAHLGIPVVVVEVERSDIGGGSA
jgi:hypothetical protein